MGVCCANRQEYTLNSKLSMNNGQDNKDNRSNGHGNLVNKAESLEPLNQNEPKDENIVKENRGNYYILIKITN